MYLNQSLSILLGFHAHLIDNCGYISLVNLEILLRTAKLFEPTKGKTQYMGALFTVVLEGGGLIILFSWD